MAAPLPNLGDLNNSWEEFLKAKNNQGRLTQDEKWRQANPGEWSKLRSYYDGVGVRPQLGTVTGRRMVFMVDAILKARGAPEPVPTYKKVAPITVRAEGGSDQRVCLFEPGGALRPGVYRRPDGYYSDESGAVYASNGDGLEESSIRTKVTDPALVGAKSMDNRSVCECPPVGDPTKNTGSWTV